MYTIFNRIFFVYVRRDLSKRPFTFISFTNGGNCFSSAEDVPMNFTRWVHVHIRVWYRVNFVPLLNCIKTCIVFFLIFICPTGSGVFRFSNNDKFYNTPWTSSKENRNTYAFHKNPRSVRRSFVKIQRFKKPRKNDLTLVFFKSKSTCAPAGKTFTRYAHTRYVRSTVSIVILI